MGGGYGGGGYGGGRGRGRYGLAGPERELQNARPADRDRQRHRFVRTDDKGGVRPVVEGVAPGMEEVAKWPQVWRRCMRCVRA